MQQTKGRSRIRNEGKKEGQRKKDAIQAFLKKQFDGAQIPYRTTTLRMMIENNSCVWEVEGQQRQGRDFNVARPRLQDACTRRMGIIGHRQ
jgi:hypothetical protein